MKNLVFISESVLCAAALVAVSGCQTRITAEKNPEQIVAIQKVVTVDGREQVITTDAIRASGGWYATARSPLWATEELRGLSISVGTNGTVSLSLDAYDRDLSTNAVVVTKTLVDGAIMLTEKVAAAMVTSGGSVAAEGAKTAISALVAKYISAGGNADNAVITCENGNCTISDGLVSCSGGLCSDAK